MLAFYLLSLPLALAVVAVSAAAVATTKGCNRQCLTNMVDEILTSMVAHNPDILPLADLYKATENSHPAALTMMQSWRTIVSAGEPSLLAIDVNNGSAYFALDINEGDPYAPNILRGRIVVFNDTLTEIELFIHRSRGDHGFSFSPEQLANNSAVVMDVPSNATLPTREELMTISKGLFNGADYENNLTIADSCQFTEIGWLVPNDHGPYGNGTSYGPAGCEIGWTDGPFDTNARVGLVIDEQLGLVVQSGMIPGVVYAYRNLSAFIPDAFPGGQNQSVQWTKDYLGDYPLLYAFGSTGETMEVLQYYNGALQAIQINVFMNPPNATSAWLSM
ncbi:hypothetical protein EDD37DRAFT_683926 [Exophiala viscosa]|uniref:uncharacterized protein n=1 Tax=Exophiala viscosa TaxID=2486360 RepID=UPI00219732CB|nr:hypothetical protein EDD37DRAFT_683926 [Exophiala viscosa]